jgi:hypothetical protein
VHAIVIHNDHDEVDSFTSKLQSPVAAGDSDGAPRPAPIVETAGCDPLTMAAAKATATFTIEE